MEVEVRCYSGFKGEEKPISFTCGDRSLEIVEIERGWYEEDEASPGGGRKARFRVRTDDGKAYVLSRDLASGRWSMEG